MERQARWRCVNIAAKQITFGVLILFILSASVYVLLPDNIRIDVQGTKTTFKVWENNTWVLSGTEYTKVYDGSSLMKANSRVVNYTFDNATNKTIIYRYAYFKDNISAVDTYFFDGNIKDISDVPTAHEIKVLNGKGKILVYEVNDLQYSGITKNNVSSPQAFGHKMKVTWNAGNYYSQVFKYAGKDVGKLTVKYRVPSADFLTNVRLFDPLEEGNINIWSSIDDFDEDTGIKTASFPNLTIAAPAAALASSDVVEYFNGSDYVAINTSIVSSSGYYNYDYEMTSSFYKVFFRNNTNTGGTITTAPVRFEKDGYVFTYDISGGKLQWTNAPVNPGQVKSLGNTLNTQINVRGNKAVYVNGYSNTDVEYEVQNDMLKETLILKSLVIEDYAFLEYSGNIKFNRSLTICTDEKCFVPSGSQDDFNTSGKIYFKDTNNVTIFYLSEPNITDANGNSALGIYFVSGSDAQMNFDLRINKTFLANATFPVMIDPSVKSAVKTKSTPKFLYSVVDFDNACSYYSLNITEGSNDVLRSLGVNSYKEDVGSLKNGRVEFLTNQTTFYNVSNSYLNETFVLKEVDNFSENESLGTLYCPQGISFNETHCIYNESIPNGTSEFNRTDEAWVELKNLSFNNNNVNSESKIERNDVSLINKSEVQFRICGNYIPINGKVAIDHIPVIEGIKHSEWTWWNASFSKSKSLIFTELSGKNLTNYPIRLNISNLTSLASCNELRVVFNNVTSTPFDILQSGSNWCDILTQINLSASEVNNTNYTLFWNSTAGYPFTTTWNITNQSATYEFFINKDNARWAEIQPEYSNYQSVIGGIEINNSDRSYYRGYTNEWIGFGIATSVANNVIYNWNGSVGIGVYGNLTLAKGTVNGWRIYTTYDGVRAVITNVSYTSTDTDNNNGHGVWQPYRAASTWSTTYTVKYNWLKEGGSSTAGAWSTYTMNKSYWWMALSPSAAGKLHNLTLGQGAKLLSGSGSGANYRYGNYGNYYDSWYSASSGSGSYLFVEFSPQSNQNFTALVNNSIIALLNPPSYTFGSEVSFSSCTYSGSGNWAINASHQCNLTSTNLKTNNVTIIGSSNNECCTRGLANLTNYTFLKMENAYVYS